MWPKRCAVGAWPSAVDMLLSAHQLLPTAWPGPLGNERFLEFMLLAV